MNKKIVFFLILGSISFNGWCTGNIEVIVDHQYYDGVDIANNIPHWYSEATFPAKTTDIELKDNYLFKFSKSSDINSDISDLLVRFSNEEIEEYIVYSLKEYILSLDQSNPLSDVNYYLSDALEEYFNIITIDEQFFVDSFWTESDFYTEYDDGTTEFDYSNYIYYELYGYPKSLLLFHLERIVDIASLQAYRDGTYDVMDSIEYLREYYMLK